MTTRFYDEALLIERLAHAVTEQRKIVFLVGAPLSASEIPGKPGVASVSEVIQLIREEFRGQPELLTRLDDELSAPGAFPYQKAFEYLIGARGQDVANRVVQKAVLMARDPMLGENGKESSADEELEILEKDLANWILPSGVRTLGRLLADHPRTIGSAVLTSNFDPLIEVALRKHGGNHYRTVLHRDGDLGQTTGDGCHIVHLHGYWIGRDTLHTPRQLQQERPRLRQSLGRLLENALVVVLAYGGWDDAFTRALMEVVSADDAHPEVIWTFHDSDHQKIESEQTRILQLLSPGLDRGRVTLFAGINCNDLLPRLREELENETSGAVVKIGQQSTSRLMEIQPIGEDSTHYEIRLSLSSDDETTPVSDNPPQTDLWVGRKPELALLEQTAAKLIVITGIGGQGKSALAAHHLRQLVEREKKFELWDWRDCREQGDRLQTQMIAVLIRIGEGKVDPAILETQNFDAILDIFFATLGERKCIFVFDNVDHYIDLAHFEAVPPLSKLLDAAIKRPHRSRFIVTCRPEIRYDDTTVLPIPLAGLSLSETTTLFEKRSVPKREFAHIPAAHELTDGHPLWLNIIAVQANRRKGGLGEVLKDIRGGKGTLPENTLRSTWKTLNEKQRQVLRTMAELEKAETVARLTQIIPAAMRHRSGRALRTLISLNLVVIKAGSDSPDLVDLHPLVRQFIRKEFLITDREPFINIVVGFFDRMIGRYRGQLDKQPSLSILEHWIHKAELELNRGHYQDAISTVYEVSDSLATRGFLEELVRIGKRIFQEIDWAEACVTYKDFDYLVARVINTQIQLGQFSEAEKFIERYAEAIPGKSAQYINMCDLRTYLYWFQGLHPQAIYWGEQGERLLEGSKADTRFTTKNHLALARRDNGEVKEALAAFLEGHTLEEVIAPGKMIKDKQGAFYGNIGRCLQMMGRLDEALVVIKKSALLLENADDPQSIVNRGYARLWLAELLEKRGDFGLAAAFYRAAIAHWKPISPPRARMVEEEFKDLMDRGSITVESLMAETREPESVASAWIRH